MTSDDQAVHNLCGDHGSLPRKSNNAAMRITIAEQIASAQEAFEAGASIAHCHVRNDDETPSSDPEQFGGLLEGLREHCPGLIVQFSTGPEPDGNGAACCRCAPTWPRLPWGRTTSRPESTRTARTWSIGWPPRC